MQSKVRTQPPRQTSLTLSTETHWEQLPREMRERCRALVVQLLTRLVRDDSAGENDDER